MFLIRKVSLMALAVVGMLAFSVPVAQAQDMRGAKLQCSHSMLPELIAGTATFTFTAGGVPIEGATVILTCLPTDLSVSLEIVQPNTADGWTLTFTYSATFGTFSCGVIPDSPITGSFTPGTFPRVREKCDFPTGETSTFSLSRNS